MFYTLTKLRIVSGLLIAHGIENLSVLEENCVMQSQSEDLDKTQHSEVTSLSYYPAESVSRRP